MKTPLLLSLFVLGILQVRRGLLILTVPAAAWAYLSHPAATIVARERGVLLFAHSPVNDEESSESAATSDEYDKFSAIKSSSNRQLYKQLKDLEEMEEYSRCLSPREERKSVLQEGDEYDDKAYRWWNRAIQAFKTKVTRKKTGTLILIRCGESTYHANQTFTGWMDPPLSENGVEQCRHAAQLLLAEGHDPDVVYTSRLKRAITSSWNILETMDALFIPVHKTYRLNQRMYGALQGLSKEETAKEFGPEVVQAWRTSLKARPPPLNREDPLHPRQDRRYADLPDELLPTTESILDCQERVRPLWEHKIQRDIQDGKTVMVVGHRDTLRGLCKSIDGIAEDAITEVHIPLGVPIVYKFDQHLHPIEPSDPSLSQIHTSGTFLEKPGQLREAIDKQLQWNQAFSGLGMGKKRVNTLEKSLQALRHVEEDLISEIQEAFVSSETSGASVDEEASMVKFKEGRKNTSMLSTTERWSDDPCEFEEYDFFVTREEDEASFNIASVPLPKEAAGKEPDGPFVVLIRHGRTPHNNMGLFTGWEDPPLASDGVEDARNAGRILKRHGYEFDVCYTSWLTRAIQTAIYCLEELDTMWLPMVKSWRLNERMYGALTGKSKKMIANEYGEEQLVKWRRGYTIRPPATSSYSLSYPGNDLRRAKHFKDLRISAKETINRSIEDRKLSIHRKFPKTESLKDCMDRSIPFYTERIKKEAVDQGKRVLITSHENAIRGILMHLCDIPQDAMNQLHLPNGLPLVYNVRGRCITLLDDGSGQDPMKQHDFGPAAKYLFRPCELDDSFFEEMASST